MRCGLLQQNLGMRLSVSLFGATLRLAHLPRHASAQRFPLHRQAATPKHHTTASTDSCDRTEHDEILSCRRRWPRSPHSGPGHVARRFSGNVEHQVQQDAHWSGRKMCHAMRCCDTPVLTSPHRASTTLSTTSSSSLSAPASPTLSPRMAITRRHTTARSRTHRTLHARAVSCSSSTAPS